MNATAKKPAVCKHCKYGSNTDRRMCACGRLCCRHLSIIRAGGVVICGPCNLANARMARHQRAVES